MFKQRLHRAPWVGCGLMIVCACGEEAAPPPPPMNAAPNAAAASPLPANAPAVPDARTAAAGSVGSTTPARAGAAGGAGTHASAPTSMSMSMPALGAEADGGTTPPSSDDVPPCLQKNSQLVVVGDSYLNWLTHDFPDDFTRALGHDYRMYAEPGASMASGGIATPIPDQFAMALADDPDIHAVVMTGGGNDILLPDTELYPGSDECKDRPDSPSLQVCQDVVAAALAAARKLMQTAAQAGTRDVVYIYYPHIPGNLLGVYALSPNEILDYSQPMARAACDGAEADTSGQLRCHFLDLQPIFQDHPEWFADDGIHENADGSAVIADQVVMLMNSKCIAQPADSTCCAP